MNWIKKILLRWVCTHHFEQITIPTDLDADGGYAWECTVCGKIKPMI